MKKLMLIIGLAILVATLAHAQYLTSDDFELGFQTPPWTLLMNHVVIESDGHAGSSSCLALYENNGLTAGLITAPIEPQQSFSIEAWIQRRPNQNNRNYFFFSLTEGPAQDAEQVGLRFRYGRYQHETITVVWNTTELVEVPVSFDYDWTKIVLTRYENGSWDFYWDNELIISDVYDNHGTLVEPHLNIFGDGFYNEGGIRVDDIEVSPSTQTLPVDDYTQVLYHFDETPGTYTAFDATDYNHDLTLSNGAEFTPNGLYGGALDMTAPGPQTANNDLVGNGWDELTIEASIFATELGTDWRPIVFRCDWHNATDPSYYLAVDTDGSLFGGVYLNQPGTDATQVISGPGVIEVGQWYSLKMTWHSGDHVRIFVDDQLVVTSTDNHVGTIRQSDDPLGIGYVHQGLYSPDYFIGYIDEVRISNIDRYDYQPPTDPVTLTLYPSNTSIPPGGGTLTYSANLVSTLPSTFTGVYYWTNLVLPNGNQFPPNGWLMSRYMVLRPYMDRTITGLSQNVPGFANPGEYELQAHFGYMDGLHVNDSFTFTKQDGVTDLFDVWDWEAGGWDQDEAALTGPLPVDWSMAPVFPNPFNPTATVSIALPEKAELKVALFNTMGQQVAELANGQFNAGVQTFTIDGSSLASGIFFVRVIVPGHLDQVQKVMLVR